MTPLRLAAFSAPQLAMAVLGLPVVLFLQPWLALQPGLSLASVGAVFLVTRIFDVVTDPTFGWLGDVTVTRWGRRKFWIALNVPVMMLGVALLFLGAPPAGPWSLAALLCLLYTGWTFVHMSHLSWSSEAAPGYDARTVMNGWTTGAYVLGILGALAIGGAAAQGGGDTEAVLGRQLRTIGLVTLVLLPAATAVAFLAAPEPPVPARRPFDLGAVLRTMAGDRPLQRVVAVDFLLGLAGGVAGSSLVFIGAQRLGLPPSQTPLLILVSFVAGLVAVPGWAWLAKRTTKHDAVIWASVWQLATTPLVLLVPRGDFGAAVAVWALTGLNFSAGIFLARAILGDVADAARTADGVDRTGSYFGLLSASNKLGYAAAGLAYVALGAVGYEPAAAAQTPLALGWLTGMFVGVPMACAALTIALMWRFPVGRPGVTRGGTPPP